MQRKRERLFINILFATIKLCIFIQTIRRRNRGFLSSWLSVIKFFTHCVVINFNFNELFVFLCLLNFFLRNNSNSVVCRFYNILWIFSLSFSCIIWKNKFDLVAAPHIIPCKLWIKDKNSLLECLGMVMCLRMACSIESYKMYNVWKKPTRDKCTGKRV